jgi:hypothetical protein
MVSSPILIMSAPPCRKICFASTGSSAGSSSSPTFSSRTGLPKRTALTSERRKSFSLNLITSKPLPFSMFLIHLLAWPCGSILQDIITVRNGIPDLERKVVGRANDCIEDGFIKPGTYIRDQRRDLLSMIAFSVDRESVGRPAMFHARIFTGSESVLRTPAPSVKGIP